MSSDPDMALYISVYQILCILDGDMAQNIFQDGGRRNLEF